MEIDFKKKFPSIPVIVGGLLCIIALFLAWIDLSSTIFSDSCNAFGLIGDADSKWYAFDQANKWKAFLPLFAGILALVAAVFAVLDLMKFDIEPKKINVIYIVTGALALVLCIMFLTSEFGYASEGSQIVSKYMGPGEYVAIFGSLIILAVGILKQIGVFEPKAKAEEQPAVEGESKE